MNRHCTHLFLLLAGLFFGPTASFSQKKEAPAASYQSFSENLLVETKWRYAYTIHLESNTVIHQAEDNYAHFLYFKYDSTFVQFLNGSITDGPWKMMGNGLEWKFKNIKRFVISNLSEFTLDLEFSRPNAKGTFVYHFNRVESSEAPFLRPLNELPEVRVEAENPKLLAQVFHKKASKKKGKAKMEAKKTDTFISVELVGGGFYGGLDPVQRDYVVIKNDGRLIKEFKSESRKLVVSKKNIPREELEKFAEWCVAQKFFDCKREYDCKAAFCEKRKGQKPVPTPLRLCISYGNVRKMVSISIWGYDDRGIKYVEYPPEIDHIVEAIWRMANRLES